MFGRRSVVLLLVASLLASLGAVAPAAAPTALAGIGPRTWIVGPGDVTSACPTPDFQVGLAGDGSDQAAIQAAVDAASPGDTVYLCNDTYDLTTGITVDRTLTFEGESSTGTSVSGGDTVRLFDAVLQDVAFRSLTLEHGYASGAQGWGSGNGGAVRGMNVTIEDAIVRNNATYEQGLGGAIFASGTDASRNGGELTGGTVVVRRSVFTANQSAYYGGAIYAESSYETVGAIDDDPGLYVDGNVDVSASTFVDNTSGNGSGGAIYTMTATVTDSHFAGNVASQGGAIGASGDGNPYVDDELVGPLVLTLAIERSTFVANSAIQGGAVYSGYGALAITDGTFTANVASYEGGAIEQSNGGLVTIDSSRFTGHVVDYYGGAVYAPYANVESRDSVYLDNRAGGGYGGAITAGNPGFGSRYVTSVGDRFERNVAITSCDQSPACGDGFGGAIHANGSISVTDGTFESNWASSGGGAIASVANIYGDDTPPGSISIDRSTFHRNGTDAAGGAAYMRGNSLVAVVNATFVENSAGSAGGAISSAYVEVTNATFVDDTAGTGDHVHAYETLSEDPEAPIPASGSLTATDSLFAGGDCDASTATAIGTNLTTDASCPGSVEARDDLRLFPLGEYGGPTRTVILGPGSVAIDATTGIADDGVCAVDVDQRGETRPKGDLCDIGAVESTLLVVKPATNAGPFCQGGYDTIQAAVGAAESGAGDLIYLCAGRYDLPDSVVIYQSGFTFLGEDRATTIVDGGGQHRLFDASGLDITVRGLTLQNGIGDQGGAILASNATVSDVLFRNNRATGTGEEYGGGAIAVGADITVADSVFEENTAGTCTVSDAGCLGGAIYAGGAVTVTGSEFTDNSAGQHGGAIYTGSYGSLTSVDSVYVGNRAGHGNGGAIAAANGSVSLTRDAFEGNVALYEGGAVRAELGVTTVATDFSANTTTGYFGVAHGGAISSVFDVSVSEGTFEANHGGFGGAIWSGSAVTVSDAIFHGNSSDGDGGAIRAQVTVTSSGSLYSENTAGSLAPEQRGGAIMVDGTVTSTDDTFLRNRAPQNGGAIAGVTLELTRSDFTANTSGAEGGAIAGAWTTITGGTFFANSAGSVAGAVRTITFTSTGTRYLDNTAGTDPGAPDRAGGAVYTAGFTLSTSDRFEGNVSPTNGGAIFSQIDAVAVSDGTFVGNRASSGGAIYGESTVATVDGRFEENSAGTAGGAIVSVGQATITGGTFVGNHADFAGALWAIGPILTIDADFEDNTAATVGGAIRGITDIVTVTTTFTRNRAGTLGGAIRGDARVTLYGGTFTENSAGSHGGAVHAASALVTIGSTFEDNISGASGGAIRGETTVAISDGTFTRNHAAQQGGAVSGATTVSLTDGTFSDNSAGTDGGAIRGATVRVLHGTYGLNRAANGGALYASTSLTASDGTFTGNTATQKGGAVYGDATVTLTDGTYADNVAGTQGGAVHATRVQILRGTYTGNRAADGGAISGTDGTCSVCARGATFTGNRASSAGGAILGIAISVTDGTFADNTAGSSGGAIHATDGLAVRATTLLRNRAIAGYGGALYSYSGPVALTDGTSLAGNSAGGAGGAVFSGSAMTAADTVFEDNVTSTNGGGFYAAAASSAIRSRFDRNVASSSGGALSVTGVATVTDTSLTGNRAANAGAIVASGGVVATRSSFARNVALYGNGGAFSTGAAATLTRTDFTANQAAYFGGAIYVSGNVSVIGGSFVENTTGGSQPARGGGIWAGGSVSVSDASFIRNKTLGYDYYASLSGYGGGIYAAGAVSVTDGTFTGNIANVRGGAIAADGALSVNGSSFTGNEAYYGGALFGGGAITSVASSYRSNLVDGLYGGAISADGGGLTTLRRNLFAGNDAATRANPGSGGAVAVYGSAAGLDSALNTYVGNVADGAGAIYVAGSASMSLAYDTFVDDTGGSSDHVYFGSSGSITRVTGVLFAGGTCDGLTGASASTGTVTTSASCPGTVVTRSALRLDALAANGGPTDTVALLPGSAAIDAISGEGSPCTSATTDQRGETRPALARCDAGAYEYQGALERTTATTVVATWDGRTITGGARVKAGGSVSLSASIVSAGYDASEGTVRFYACSNLVAVPTDCTAGTPNRALVGTADTVDAGTPGDGIGTATLDGWQPARDAYYRVVASYLVAGGVIGGSDSTAGSATFLVGDLTSATRVRAFVGLTELTAGVTITTGDAVAIYGDVSSADLSELTVGTVVLRYCRNGLTVPVDCSAGTPWVDVTAGIAVNGLSSAVLQGWTAPRPGYYRLAGSYSSGDSAILASLTTGGAAFRVARYPTAISLTATSGAADLTAGVVLGAADPVSVTTTLTNLDGRDVSVGTVVLRYCRSTVSVPADCTAGTPWVEATAGVAVGAGGVVTITSWTPPLTGFYRLAASYSSGDDGDFATSETTAGSAVFEARLDRPVTLAWEATAGGAVVAAATTFTVRARVTNAGTSDVTAGCRVTFSFSDGSVVTSVEATSGVDGIAAAAVTGGRAAGVYFVTMTTSNGCASATPAWGVVTVGPTSGFARGTVGAVAGGWYFRDGTSGARVSFGVRIEATTGTAKVNRQTITTTTTRIAAVVVSDDGWLVETRTTDVSTGTLTPWLRETCPTSLSDGVTVSIAAPRSLICGRLITRAPNVRNWQLAGSWQSWGQLPYTLRLADGGTAKATGDVTDWVALVSVRNNDNSEASFPIRITSPALRPLRGGTGYATNPYRGSIVIY